VRQRPFVFGGLNWQGVSQSSATPPDTTGAIGLNHYVEATNDAVRVYTRTDGSQVSTIGLDTFLGVPGDSVSDPQILWDQGTGRWFYAGIGVNTGSEEVLFGWSKTADPSDLANGWCNFSIATTGVLDDFPKLGDYDTRIVIGANRFLGNTFQTAVIYAIDKPPAGTTCALPAFNQFGSAADPLKQSNNQDTFTPVPANTTDGSNVGYVVAADSPNGGGGSHIEAFHLSGAGTSLIRDGPIAVSSFAVPANAPQSGSTNVIDTSDSRLTQAVAHTDPAVGANAVWTQHTVAGAGGGPSVVRWYELIPSQLSARQAGTVAESADFAFNAAVSPATDGASAVIDYNASGPGSFPRIAVRSRRPSSGLGQMSPAVTLASSSGPHDDFSCSPPDPCRWGDYASAVPDPLNSGLVWGTNEYTLGGTWTTRNFAIDVGGDGPLASFSASAAAIDSGQTVAFDASSTTGSGGVAVNQYEWDLDGDGSFETDTGSDPHASRSYSTPANLTVRLRVTDTAGDQSQAARTVVVRNRPPIAVVTLSSPSILVGQAASLNGASSSDPDGRVTRYQWDLNGDGSFETDTGAGSATSSLPFAAPAALLMHLRVTDDRGATGDAAAPLTVLNPPPTAECIAAKARVKRLATSVRKLKRQVKRAHGARKRRLARKLRKTRRQLANARVRVHTVC
jgi:YD repeat-containing protein